LLSVPLNYISIKSYAERRFLPLARLLVRTLSPPFVAFLALNPCLLFLTSTLG